MIDLKTLRNDDLRIEFLEDYRNMDNGWYLWKEDHDLNRKFWRLDLPGEIALIVEEHLRTLFSYVDKSYPKKWLVQHWFVVEDWDRPFDDNSGSRTMALQKLKEAQKTL